MKKENEALEKSVSDKQKLVEEYTKQFEEYKEKIGKTNAELNAYKTELEEVTLNRVICDNRKPRK